MNGIFYLKSLSEHPRGQIISHVTRWTHLPPYSSLEILAKQYQSPITLKPKWKMKQLMKMRRFTKELNSRLLCQSYLLSVYGVFMAVTHIQPLDFIGLSVKTSPQLNVNFIF
jgi:radical SAM superfamily enzyme